jgi:hypothetical protein
MKDAIRYRIPAMNPVMKMTFAANVIRAVAVAALLATTATAQEKEALTLQLPAPTLKGTPEQLPTGPNIEANSDKAPAAMQIAKGAKNVALGKHRHHERQAVQRNTARRPHRRQEGSLRLRHRGDEERHSVGSSGPWRIVQD